MSTTSPDDYNHEYTLHDIASPKTCTISQPFKIVE